MGEQLELFENSVNTGRDEIIRNIHTNSTVHKSCQYHS